MADVDSIHIHQLLEPISDAQPVPRQKAPSRDVPSYTPALVFVGMGLIGYILVAIVSFSPPVASIFQTIGICALLFLLISTAVGACWVLVRSEKPRLKSTWVSAFAGLLTGLMLAMMGIYL